MFALLYFIVETNIRYHCCKLSCWHTANLHNEILDCLGFDSSIILSLRGGILKPIGNFPESLSQSFLVGIILVGRLGATGKIILLEKGLDRQSGPLGCSHKVAESRRMAKESPGARPKRAYFSHEMQSVLRISICMMSI